MRVILNFLGAKLKRVKREEVTIILVMFYLTQYIQNTVISTCA